MKTHDKKWAIQQMLDGKKVLQGESTILRYCYGEFYQVAGDCMGAVEINSLPKGGYTLYEEPEKVELLEEAIMVMENKIADRVGFVHEGSEGCSDEVSDPLRISSKCLRVTRDFYNTNTTAEEAIHEVGMLLAGELDRIDRELKIYKHVFLKDQMIEDGEL